MEEIAGESERRLFSVRSEWNNQQGEEIRENGIRNYKRYRNLKDHRENKRAVTRNFTVAIDQSRVGPKLKERKEGQGKEFRVFYAKKPGNENRKMCDKNKIRKQEIETKNEDKMEKKKK